MTATAATTERLQQFARDPAAFRDALMIDTDNGVRPLGATMDAWQERDFLALDESWMRVAHPSLETDAPTRMWAERPRGHSKSCDLAVMAIWALAFSPRPIRGVACAGDKDQARFLRDAVATLVRCNPWLASTLDVQANRIRNTRTDSVLEVMAADAPSSYGLLCDFVVADELCHWSKRDLWDSLLSTSAKRAHCLLAVISNAGFTESWQYETRQAIRHDPRWYFSQLTEPCASWISRDVLDEQAKLLPPLAYKRLWLNEWCPGSGDALDPEDLEAAVTMAGPLEPWSEERGDYSYFVGGLDLGLKRDHSGFVVLGVDAKSRRYRLCECESWAPPRVGGTISLEAVKSAVLRSHTRYGGKMLVAFDPWQAALMAEQLRGAGVHCHETAFTPSNLDRMATCLLQTFRNRQIDLYDDRLLLKDLSRLTIIERQKGFRLQATRDESGHGDRATALAIALPAAEEAFRAVRKMWHRDATEVNEVIYMG